MLIQKRTSGYAIALILAASFTATVANAQQSGDRRGPPQEAITACEGLTEESVCSFSHPKGEATGLCMAGPRDSEALACRPEGGPPKQG